MKSFLANAFLVVLAVGCTYYHYTLGWGLHPQSWWAIGMFGVLGPIGIIAMREAMDKL